MHPRMDISEIQPEAYQAMFGLAAATSGATA
jgi:hypothetical protein